MEVLKKTIMIIIVIALIVSIAGGILYILYSNDIIAIGNEKEQMLDNSYEKFNNEFVNYAGMQRGSTVKTLINVIKENNGKEEKHQITIEYEGSTYEKDEDMTQLSKNIQSSDLYELQILKDENSYINNIKILKK